MVSKKHSGKADQSTLASGGSAHAKLLSVAISWGNKMNFSLSANMSGFCSDSHNYYYTSRSIMSQAKFNLQSWASNSAAVQSLAQAHNVAERDDITKVLGLLWHRPSDTLSLAFKITAGDHPNTKQEILQGSSSTVYLIHLDLSPLLPSKLKSYYKNCGKYTLIGMNH